MAGYGAEGKALIDSKPGFSSRIKYQLIFQNYSLDELSDILRSMAKSDGLTVEDEFVHTFKLVMSVKGKQKNFGNGREVRNYLDKAIDRHALNLKTGAISKDKTKILVDADSPVRR